MTTIRERIEIAIAGRRLAHLEEQIANQQAQLERQAAGNRFMLEAYLDGPFVLPPEQVAQRLQEYYDPQIIDTIVDLLNYEVIGGYGGYNEDERARAVLESQRIFKYSTLARWGASLWTFYALGANLQIVPDDEQAQVVWTEFITAKRNKAVMAKDRIDELSRWLLVTGERCLSYYSSTKIGNNPGRTTVRTIIPSQIKRVLTNPDDETQAWFYERKWTRRGENSQRVLYYPDWELFFSDTSTIQRAWTEAQKAYQLDSEAQRADLIKQETPACVQFVPYMQLDEDSIRGWPLFGPHVAPWLRAYREFLQNRLAVSRSVATFVRRYTTAGGSRQIDTVKQALASSHQYGAPYETNPIATAGSSEVVNRALDVEELPLRTGAADAKSDSEMFAWYSLLGLGIFPHYAGMGDAYRLATATAMEKPMELQFSLYRSQLSAMFREEVEIVLRFYERYGSTKFKTYESQVSTDKMVNLDANKITESLGRVWRETIVPLMQMGGNVPEEVIDNMLVYTVQTTLGALGLDSPEEVIDEEMFEPTEEVAKEAAAALAESHKAELVERTCPLCAYPRALSYPDHGGLLVCANCHKTFDPKVE